jgi:hypothetical protein
MTELALAIDVNGEPFDLPGHITGWRVRRLQPDGRGRPELVYDPAGRPVLLPLHAGFADVLQAAGPGRYRLDPVDHRGRTDEKLPTGVTGYMQALDSAGDGARVANENGYGAIAGAKPASPGPLSELGQLLAMTVQHNTQMATTMATTMATQLSAIMTATSQLLAAADGASITTRLPPPPPPAPVTEVVYEQAPPTQPAWVEWLGAVIVQAAPTLVPMLISKLPGLPLGALLDWRKAVPTATPTAPSAPTAPAAPTATSAPAAWPAANTNAAPSGATAPASPTGAQVAHAAHVASSAPAASASTAPAEPSAAAPGTDRPEPTPDELNAAVTAHMTQIWASLTPAEQARGTRLVALLTEQERAAWIAELSTLSVPEALERVRYVIRPNEAPPAAPVSTGGVS